MDIKHLNLNKLRITHCSDCAVNSICLPHALAEEDLEQLENIIGHNHPIMKGEKLFLQGSRFESIFAVQSGAIKTCATTFNGEEKITGFYFPGDIVSLDSVGHDVYESTATALEITTICVIPFTALETLSRKHVMLNHHIFKLMSSELRNDHLMMQIVGKRTADGRVSNFLLSLSARYKRRNINELHIYLPMSRADIGNHLGLALETVSRIFTYFQELGVIQVNGKNIIILDLARLCDLADPI